MTACLISSHLEKGKAVAASAVTTPIRSFLCSSSPVAFAHSDTLPCDKSGGPAEEHSGVGHGAQIHRWSNVCRSQGLHKHHCWEKVASPSLHTLAVVPTLASLAFPGSKILQCFVCLLIIITRQRQSGGSCMHAACNLALLTTLL